MKEHQKQDVAMANRILNQFESKIANEARVDRVTLSQKDGRSADYADIPFGCECDDPSCHQIISMSTEEYLRTHRRTKHFTVVPRHVQLDLEEIVCSFQGYTMVAKFFPSLKPLKA